MPTRAAFMPEGTLMVTNIRLLVVSLALIAINCLVFEVHNRFLYRAVWELRLSSHSRFQNYFVCFLSNKVGGNSNQM